MKNMQKYYVDGIDARPLVAKIPLFMKLCAFLLLMNVSVTFAETLSNVAVSYTHLTLPTNARV